MDAPVLSSVDCRECSRDAALGFTFTYHVKPTFQYITFKTRIEMNAILTSGYSAVRFYQ